MDENICNIKKSCSWKKKVLLKKTFLEVYQKKVVH